MKKVNEKPDRNYITYFNEKAMYNYITLLPIISIYLITYAKAHN